VNFTVSREHAEWLRWLTSWSLLAGVLGRAAEDVAVLAPILGADAVAHTETIRTTVVRHEAL
jgi:hypothetical protein